jgi:hypothetical protein
LVTSALIVLPANGKIKMRKEVAQAAAVHAEAVEAVVN